MSDEPDDQTDLLTRLKPIAAIVFGVFGLVAIAWLAHDFWRALSVR